MNCSCIHFAVQAPLSVIVFPLGQPVYATSSRTMSYHIQLQHTVKVSAYFNIQWTPPIKSAQHIPEMQVNATGKKSSEGSVSLSFLNLLDSGNYTCSVRLSSTNSYIVQSSNTEGSELLIVQG